MKQTEQVLDYCKKNKGIRTTEHGTNAHTGAPTHWTRYFVL